MVLQPGSLGEVLTRPHRKKNSHVTKSSQFPRAWTDPLVRPKQWRRDMRFGRWNVRNLYRAGSVNDSCEGISEV